MTILVKSSISSWLGMSTMLLHELMLMLTPSLVLCAETRMFSDPLYRFVIPIIESIHAFVRFQQY